MALTLASVLGVQRLSAPSKSLMSLVSDVPVGLSIEFRIWQRLLISRTIFLVAAKLFSQSNFDKTEEPFDNDGIQPFFKRLISVFDFCVLDTTDLMKSFQSSLQNFHDIDSFRNGISRGFDDDSISFWVIELMQSVSNVEFGLFGAFNSDLVLTDISRILRDSRILIESG